jgi:hypothetical protein
VQRLFLAPGLGGSTGQSTAEVNGGLERTVRGRRYSYITAQVASKTVVKKGEGDRGDRKTR